MCPRLVTADAATAAVPGNRDIKALLTGGRALGALAADRLPDALPLATRFTELARASSTMSVLTHDMCAVPTDTPLCAISLRRTLPNCSTPALEAQYAAIPGSTENAATEETSRK